MKFSYSLIKKLLPRVPSAKRLAEELNAHSFEVESVEGDTIDIKLPANIYSYASSHIGIAREAATIFNLKFGSPIRQIVNVPRGRGMLSVKVEDKRLAPRYAARYFELKKVGSSSREVQKILKSCGVNPVNAVVDIMNYVMLETGQPLHAFDADKIARGKGQKAKGFYTLVVRPAKKGEHIETLDNKKVPLDGDTLIITDGEHPLAIAGIKGGISSGVTKRTKRIIVEAANFESVNIYRTAQRLGIRTDASTRFSHGLNVALVDWGLDRATELLRAGGAKLSDTAEFSPKRPSDSLLEFHPPAYERLIGAPVLLSDAKRYFESLGFLVETKMKRGNGLLRVRVPSWRTDIDREEDLIEEIARFQGYNDLPATPPRVALLPAFEAEDVRFREQVRAFLVRLNLNEIYSSSFVGTNEGEETKFAPLAGADAVPVEVQNPISQEKKFLRPSLIPLLLGCASLNTRFFEEVRIFETGMVFGSLRGSIDQRMSLGIALAAKKNERLVFELKGILDELMRQFGIGDFFFKEAGGSVLRLEVGHHVLAEVGLVLLPKGLTAAVAEIDIQKLSELAEEEREFKTLPKHPGVARDISMIVEKDIRIGEIIRAVESSPIEDIVDVDLVDEYADEALGGKESITIRILFRADDRTLTDEEVNEKVGAILSMLKSNFGAIIR